MDTVWASNIFFLLKLEAVRYEDLLQKSALHKVDTVSACIGSVTVKKRSCWVTSVPQTFHVIADSAFWWNV